MPSRAKAATQGGSRKRLAVLGSTGSIGCNTLDVVAENPDRYEVYALSGHANTQRLKQQAQALRPARLIVTDPVAAAAEDWSDLPSETELVVGAERLIETVESQQVDLVVAAIVGSAGLPSTWAALECGKTVALANKEALVVAGPRMTELARTHGGRLIPVDSEHSAVFQALACGRRQDVLRVVLTASGGPFRTWPLERLKHVTVEQALDHPTWKMGPKITIDSATMMNKALEIIEARWLFDLRAEQIGVMVHPQSIVHSFVEFVDGSVMAQMGPPDMRLPIQVALSWPERHAGPARRVDWQTRWQLDFEPPDAARFPAVELGLDVARAGGTAGAVVNAANETAVARFLAGELEFLEIVPACRRVFEAHDFDPNPTLDALMAADRWAREEVARWVCS